MGRPVRAASSSVRNERCARWSVFLQPMVFQPVRFADDITQLEFQPGRGADADVKLEEATCRRLSSV